MTADQDVDSAIDFSLEDDSGSLRIRETKIRYQMERYGIDLMDILFALRNRKRILKLHGGGERFKVYGPSIDGLDLEVIVTCSKEKGLKILNAWQSNII